MARASSHDLKVCSDVCHLPEPFSWGLELGKMADKKPPRSGLPPPHRSQNRAHSPGTLVVDEILPAVDSSPPVMMEEDPEETSSGDAGVTDRRHLMYSCEHCKVRLGELTHQAARHFYTIASRRTPPTADVVKRIQQKLHLTESGKRYWRNDRCEVCDTHITKLKEEATNMVHNVDRNRPDGQKGSGIPVPRGHQGNGAFPRTTPHYSSAHHRLVRQTAHRSSSPSRVQSPPLSLVPHPYTETRHHRSSSRRHAQAHGSSRVPLMEMHTGNGLPPHPAQARSPYATDYMQGAAGGGGSPRRPVLLQQPHLTQCPVAGTQHPISPASSSSTSSNTSAAASFFHRAAQKLASSRKKKKHHAPEPEPPLLFPTKFSEVIRHSPPAIPPCLLRSVGRPQHPGTGKVKVMLRICPVEGTRSPSLIRVDAAKKQITIFDPANSGYATTAHRRNGVTAPKMFGFDGICSQDDSLAELCATGLSDIIQAVVNGADGCLFCYGHARLGKTYTMIGVDDRPQNLGVIPCAIAWLFRLIQEQKDKTGARFSVRVSAVEVTGKQETLKDLLADVAAGQEAGLNTAPGVYLREDPICGTQLENQSELRAPTADRAAFYLDAAVAARTVPEVEDDARNSHLLFTIHVYQYRLEKAAKSDNFAGGRSRLHLVDLGSCGRSKDGNALSLSALGNVIMSLLNGQRHVPHRESKLTQLLREAMGSLSCRTCMIAHVSPAVQAYNETLQVVQLASRIHRMKRRRNKFSSASSGSEESSSCDEAGRFRRYRTGIRMGTLRSGSLSDPDYTSSSEQSCDTVIYVGANGQPLSDRELTDNEGPPRMMLSRHVSGNRSGGSSKGSGDETDPFRDPTGIKTQYKPGATSGNRFSSGLPQPRSGSGVVQLPRRINIRTRPGPHPKSKSSEIVKRTEEQWIDGPALCEQRQEPQTSHHPSEQWVDGPRVHQGYTRGMPQPVYNVESGPKKPKKVSDSSSKPHPEHWIDGPRELKSELKSEPIYHELEPLREQAEPNEDVVPPEVQYSAHTNKPEIRLTDIESSRPIVSHKPPAMPKHKTVENIQNQEPADHQVTVPNKVNGSVTSLGVEPDSRPVSTVSICSDQEPKDQTPVPNQVSESPVPVKSFVRAWVEQHSAITAGVVNEDHLTIKTDLFTFLPPKQEQVANVEGQLSKNLRSKFVKDTNTVSSTHSSPSMKRLKKGAPSGDSPTVNPRTAEWVKCVQEQEISSGLPDQKLSESLGSLISEHPECDQDMISDSLQNLKAEGEITVTVEDTAVPADDTASAPDLSRPSDGDQMAWLTVPKVHVQKAGDNSMLDDSFESENSAGKLAVGGSNLEQMLNSNRQSIYELQMDEKLESASMKRGDACRVYNSTDDSFSDLSLPKEASAEDSHDSAKSHCDVEDIDMDKLDSALFGPEPMALDVNGNAPIGQDQEDLGQGQERQPVYETVEEVHYSEPPNQVPFPHEIVRGGQMNPLTSLRKPDGASNPNIHQEISGWGSIESKAQVKKSRTMPKDSKRGSSRNRAVIGHSSEDEKASKPSVSPVQSRGHFLQYTPGKLGFPPKSSAKNSKPAPPPRTSSELSSPQTSINGQNSHINSAPSSNTRQSRSGKSSKSSRCSSPQNTSVSSSKTSSAKSSPAKPSPVKSTRLPLFSRSSKSQSSPAKSPAKESKLPTREKSKESKERTKELKEKTKEHRSSSKESKQGRSSCSKSPSPNKKTSKKDREGRSPFGWHSKDSRPPLNPPSGSKSDDCASPRRGLVSDSDSGNDSGIGKSSHYNKSKRLLSPYATITKPRSSSHSSSGLGSDNSSMCSGSPSNKWNAAAKKEPTSSGYESMVHESEPFPSSQLDSTSESSSSGWAKKGSKKKAAGSKRSRSAPARPTDITMSSPPSSCTQSPMTVIRKPIGPSPRAWVDTRQVALLSDDKVEIQVYDMDDIDRMQRRRREEAELRAKAEHRRRVRELLSRQEQLKMELLESKSRLMIDTSTWSFDLYVAEQLDWDDPNDLEALENETEILQKRVDACKSHIMMVTCFDIKA